VVLVVSGESGMQKLVWLLSIFWCVAAIADATEDVRCSETGFSQSVEENKLEKFTSYIDADARFVGDSVLRGRQAVTEAWKVFFTEGGPAIKWRPQFVEVLEDGKLALTRGPFRMTVTGDDGNVIENWGTFNSVWRLYPDGEWKVVFDAGSQASQPPAEEVQALLDEEDSCAD
jgi:ketosteroid isomerase-like protein